MVTRRPSRGVVLLSVLLIVALLSAITIRLVSRQSLYLAHAAQSAGADLTLGYAVGAETLARQLLYSDWSETGQGVDDLSEIWAQPLAPFPLEEYNNAFMEVQLRDMGSCFNLNSLAAGQGAGQAGQPGQTGQSGQSGQQQTNLNMAAFKNMLRTLSLPEIIADRWLDWVDANDQVNGLGAEDGEYQLRDPAYRTPNQLAGHASELWALSDIEPEHVQALLPHVCALPHDQLQINVNTAMDEVLAALGPPGSTPSADQLGLRQYKSPTEFTNDFPDTLGNVDAMTVTSDYFELQTRVQIDGHVTELSSLLYRDPNTGEMRVVSRDLGKTFTSRFQEEDS